MCEQSLFVTNSIHNINKSVLCSKRNAVNHICKEVLKGLDEQVKNYLTINSMDYDEERHLPVVFNVTLKSSY
jgi:hypothetical protein